MKANQIAKSKTMILAAVVAGLGAAQANISDLQEFMTPEAYGYVTFGIGILIAALRVVTTKPLSQK